MKRFKKLIGIALLVALSFTFTKSIKVEAGYGGTTTLDSAVVDELLDNMVNHPKKATQYKIEGTTTQVYGYVTEDDEKSNSTNPYWRTVGYWVTIEQLDKNNVQKYGDRWTHYFNVKSKKGFAVKRLQGELKQSLVPNAKSGKVYTLHQMRCYGGSKEASKVPGVELMAYDSVAAGFEATFDGMEPEDSKLYFHPIVKVFNDTGDGPGPYYTNFSWLRAGGFGENTIKDSEENYNFEFEKVPDKVTIRVKYKEFVEADGFAQKHDGDARDIYTFIDPNEVKSKGPYSQSKFTLSKVFNEKDNPTDAEGNGGYGSDTPYNISVQKQKIDSDGNVWKLKYVYVCYETDPAGRYTTNTQKFSYDFKTGKVDKDTRYDYGKPAQYPNLKGVSMSWTDFINHVKTTDWYCSGTGDVIVYFRYVKEAPEVTVKYEYQRVNESGAKEWVQLKEPTTAKANSLGYYEKDFAKRLTDDYFSLYGLYSITAWDSSTSGTTKTYVTNELNGKDDNKTMVGSTVK